jgi:hypothetical protein
MAGLASTISIKVSRNRSLYAGEVKYVVKETGFKLKDESFSTCLDSRPGHMYSPFYDLRKEPLRADQPRLINKRFRCLQGTCQICGQKYSSGLLNHVNSTKHKIFSPTVRGCL